MLILCTIYFKQHKLKKKKPSTSVYVMSLDFSTPKWNGQNKITETSETTKTKPPNQAKPLKRPKQSHQNEEWHLLMNDQNSEKVKESMDFSSNILLA